MGESQDLSFEPVFMDELTFVDSSLNEICGSDKKCQFDYLVTRKESVAVSTKQIGNKFEKVKTELEQDGRCD